MLIIIIFKLDFRFNFHNNNHINYLISSLIIYYINKVLLNDCLFSFTYQKIISSLNN